MQKINLGRSENATTWEILFTSWQYTNIWGSPISSKASHMGDFNQGGEWLLKNVPIFLYGKDLNLNEYKYWRVTANL